MSGLTELDNLFGYFKLTESVPAGGGATTHAIGGIGMMMGSGITRSPFAVSSRLRNLPYGTGREICAGPWVQLCRWAAGTSGVQNFWKREKRGSLLTYERITSNLFVDARRSAQTDRCRTRNPDGVVEYRTRDGARRL